MSRGTDNRINECAKLLDPSSPSNDEEEDDEADEADCCCDEGEVACGCGEEEVEGVEVEKREESQSRGVETGKSWEAGMGVGVGMSDCMMAC